MKVELWTIYFDPVPLGIGPVAATLARELAARGHDVTVVTSHPHYPKPNWGTSWRRRRRDWEGVEVFELPVYTRRQSALQRAAEEATYGFKQTTWALRARKPDVIVATLPSLLCVPGALLHSRIHGTPWVVWLQDIVSSAAETTGIVGGSRLSPALARIEQAAFDNADRTVVISDAFRRQLLELGVPSRQIERIYLGSPRKISEQPRPAENAQRVILVIGNIGLTQNLPAFVRAFQDCAPLREIGAELRITGDGVQTQSVRAAIESEGVTYLGLVSDEELEAQLAAASVGLITQSPAVSDFNLPSKFVTYTARGLPVFAVVDPATEIARLVEASGAGVVASNTDLLAACQQLSQVLVSSDTLSSASGAALGFAREHFEPQAMAAKFERVLLDAISNP